MRPVSEPSERQRPNGRVGGRWCAWPNQTVLVATRYDYYHEPAATRATAWQPWSTPGGSTVSNDGQAPRVAGRCADCARNRSRHLPQELPNRGVESRRIVVMRDVACP